MTKKYVADIETYANCFTLVACDLETEEFLEFVLHKERNEAKQLIEFLQSKPAFIGFNWINFDGQVVEKIYREHLFDPAKIYDFAQEVIKRLGADRFDMEYSEWDLSFPTLDLFKLMHYDNRAKMTSLKWLEFTTRQKKIADLPYHHTQEVNLKQVEDILVYNKYDVEKTKAFYDLCEEHIDLRRELTNEYREPRILNMSDSTIGSYMFGKILSQELGISEQKLKKGRTHRKEIVTKDIILPYVDLKTPEFKGALEFYNQTILKPIEGEIKLKGVLDYNVEYDGMEYSFGAGGLHAARENNFFKANDEVEILTIDAKSYYPHLSFLNSIYPEHLGPQFCPIFKNIFEERKKYPKGSAKNAAYKIILNGSYGRTNSKYSFLYDPQMTLSICVNGQLSLCMLAELITEVGGKVIMANTDGVECLVPRENKADILEACRHWEVLTGQTLEYDYYSKLFLKDCNNYIAVDTEGKVKRKGQFEIYDDIVENSTWHKNPSAMIIPKAINEFVVNGTEVEETVESENNIHEFLYGVKKTKAFKYIWWVADENFICRPKKKLEDRVVRYYASTDGGSLYKHWNDGRITGLNVGQLITPAQTLRSPRAELFKNLDRDYYIKEAEKIINEVLYNS